MRPRAPAAEGERLCLVRGQANEEEARHGVAQAAGPAAATADVAAMVIGGAAATAAAATAASAPGRRLSPPPSLGQRRGDARLLAEGLPLVAPEMPVERDPGRRKLLERERREPS